MVVCLTRASHFLLVIVEVGAPASCGAVTSTFGVPSRDDRGFAAPIGKTGWKERWDERGVRSGPSFLSLGSAAKSNVSKFLFLLLD